MGVEQKLITIISTFLAQKCVTNQEPVSSKPFRLLVEGLIEGLFHAKWMFYIDIGTPGEPSSLKWAADWVAIHICNVSQSDMIHNPQIVFHYVVKFGLI